ncbi:Prephenate dehydratase-domain-containing protein [Xylariaceae sp. FL1272]|nr:Prephenate dehydratase-domain-containing protein [Xylariaceae sp. FL1272]
MATKERDSIRKGDQASKPVICFLGPVSSYTHQATMGVFPEDRFELMPVTTIKDIFETTQSGRATFGVVPFENSTNGSVVFTLDSFADRTNIYADLNVCREVYLDVHHCLLGHINKSPSAQEASGASRSRPLHDLSHIRRIYSHPQAFGQCRAFLGAWLRGIETIDVSSTSRAAELAFADKAGESAAISSAAAASLLGLDMLAQNIEDREDNTTRFFVLRRGTTPVPGEEDALPDPDDDGDDSALLSKTKSLLSFTVPHRSPGALADLLSCFRREGLNLTSINSRPSLTGDAAFEYVFFVEFEGHRYRDPRGRVARVLRDVEATARTWRWLGSWENMLPKG